MGINKEIILPSINYFLLLNLAGSLYLENIKPGRLFLAWFPFSMMIFIDVGFSLVQHPYCPWLSCTFTGTGCICGKVKLKVAFSRKGLGLLTAFAPDLFCWAQ